MATIEVISKGTPPICDSCRLAPDHVAAISVDPGRYQHGNFIVWLCAACLQRGINAISRVEIDAERGQD